MMLKDLKKIDFLTGRDTIKPYLKEIAIFTPAILLAAVLTACGSGGGGGSSNGNNGGNNGGDPVLTYQGLVTSVQVASYASAAENLAISSQVAAIRQGTGDGLLAQNTSLDTAASKHAAFLDDNDLASSGVYLTTTYSGILGGHYEDSNAASAVNYTGASPQARATAAGYAGTVTELMVFDAANGTACLASLENSVYHLIALVSPFIDLGIGFNAGIHHGFSVCAIEMGVRSTTLGQLPATGSVAYPYAGQTAVPPTFYNHGEAPVPASDLATVGHPVVVSLYTLTNPSLAGSDIVIHNFSITKRVGPVVLPVRVLAKTGVTSDVPALALTLKVDDVIPAAGFVVLLPTTPLEASTIYDLSFSATVKGSSTPVTKTWSFTTGIAN
jgi:uncharacterized protein YkwD